MRTSGSGTGTRASRHHAQLALRVLQLQLALLLCQLQCHWQLGGCAATSAQVKAPREQEEHFAKAMLAQPTAEGRLSTLGEAKDVLGIMQMRHLVYKRLANEDKHRLLGWASHRGKSPEDLVIRILKKIYGPDAKLPEPILVGDENFDELVLSRPPGKAAFVKFYAPWCGHCKQMKPFWDDLGAQFYDSGSMLIGDCDCTAHSALCSKLAVQGYPTLISWGPDGESEGKAYDGDRDQASLSEFVSKMLQR